MTTIRRHDSTELATPKPNAGRTPDWEQILLLYDMLLALAPSP